MTKIDKYIVGSLFFASGLTSLVYQTLWIRALSLGVGSTSTSMSLVLAIFFLGLTIGSWAAGRYANRTKYPVRVYGFLEGAIGLYSVGLIYLLFDFHHLLNLMPVTHSLSFAGLVIKFLIVFLVLIFPTTLMGASLPFLIRIFVRSNENLGGKISLLYGVNTLGGVAGAFLAGFWLIPKFGVLASNHASAVVNLLILLTAVIIAKRQSGEQASPQSAETSVSYGLCRQTWFVRLVPLSVCLTGFSSLAAEVVWNKYLGIFLGSNIFGLSLILSLFLLGIALGALALSPFVDRVRNREIFYIDLLLTCALAVLITSVCLGYAPVLASLVGYYLPGVSLLLVKSLIVAFILILPSSLLGALLPMAMRLLILGYENAAQMTGKIYALSTVGSILGSAMAGLFFIPMVGSSLTLKVCVGLLIVCSFALLSVAKGLSSSRALRFFAGVAVLLMLVGTDAISFQNIIKSAYYQSASKDMSLTEAMRYFGRTYEEFKLIYEGRTGIISLSHDPQDGEAYRDFLRLKTNGLNESIYYTKNLEALPKYEALLGLLPFSLVRNPEKAFTVGYGGGYTVDFLTSTDIRQVNVVELEEGILKAADYVYSGKNPILSRPNLNFQIEDARFVLASRRSGPYDIIVSQPSHSWLAGVANLFTLEFFEIVKGNLTDDGVFSQWLNLYNMNPEVLKSILRTFYTVFPHGAVFTGVGDQEMIMIGSKTPISFNLAKLNALAANEKMRRQLSYIPMTNAYDLVSLFTMGRSDVLKMSAGAPINTDRNAFAEVKQSQLFYSKGATDPNRFLLEHFTGDYSEVLPGSVPMEEVYKGTLKALERHSRDFYKSNRLMTRFLDLNGKGTDNLLLVAGYAGQSERYATALGLLRRLMQDKPSAEGLNALIGMLLASGHDDEAVASWKKHGRLRNEMSVCYELDILRLQRSWGAGDGLAKMLADSSAQFGVRCGVYLEKALGLYFVSRGEFLKARSHLEAYYKDAPRDMAVYRAMLMVYLETADRVNSESFAGALAAVWQAHVERIKVLADYYEAQGYGEDAEVLRKKALESFD